MWDMDLVLDLFNERDVALILDISISTATIEDNWFWKLERSGSYFVKSAYRLLQDLKGVVLEENNVGFWRKFWNLKISPKTKNIVCRAVIGCLPTNHQLVGKHVQISPYCPVCGTQVKTIICIVWSRVFLHKLVHVQSEIKEMGRPPDLWGMVEYYFYLSRCI